MELKGHYRVHNSPSQESALSQIHPLHVFTSCPFKVSFIFVLFTSSSPRFSLHICYCKTCYTFIIAWVTSACPPTPFFLLQQCWPSLISVQVMTVLLLLLVLAKSLTCLSFVVVRRRENDWRLQGTDWWTRLAKPVVLRNLHFTTAKSHFCVRTISNMFLAPADVYLFSTKY